MTQKTQQRRRDPASVGPRAEQAAGDALQQPKRLGSYVSVNHQRCRNVQHAAKQAAPENSQHGVRISQRQGSGRQAHSLFYEGVCKIFRVAGEAWRFAADLDLANPTTESQRIDTARTKKRLATP